MNRDLIIWPDQYLRKPTEDVTVFDRKLEKLVINMFEVMEKYKGVGLAAPQVGVNKSVIVYKIDGEEGILINPILTHIPDSKIEEFGEGCLSFPGVHVKIPRPNLIELKYQDEMGEWHEEEFYGFVAIAIQHELDHLEGKTIVNYLSKLKRDIVTKKMKKVQLQRAKYIKEIEKKAALHELSNSERRDTRTINVPVRSQPVQETGGVPNLSENTAESSTEA